MWFEVGIIEFYRKKRLDIDSFISNFFNLDPLLKYIFSLEFIRSFNMDFKKLDVWTIPKDYGLGIKSNGGLDHLLIVCTDIKLFERANFGRTSLNGYSFNKIGVALTVNNSKTGVHELGHIIGLEHYHPSCGYHTPFGGCQDFCEYDKYIMCPLGDGSKGFHQKDIKKLGLM